MAQAKDPAARTVAPCLTILPDLAAYTDAFKAAGWEAPEGERRRNALNTLSDAQAVATALPKIRSDAELAAFSANARARNGRLFDATSLLVNGDNACWRRC
jgi:hypothetical protein